MGSVSEGQPFALVYNGRRGVAGGMNAGKAFTEFIDDSRDAGSKMHFMKVIVLNGVQYMVNVNTGKGLASLPQLYGNSAEATPVKDDPEQSGVFNSGFVSAVAYHDPAEAYHESNTDGSMSCMTFSVEEFVNEYEKHPDNMRAANIQKYMSTGRERTVSKNELIKLIADKVTHSEMKTVFSAIFRGELENYMLHIFRMRKDKPITESIYRAFFPNLNMYYAKPLAAGFKIIMELSDPATHFEANSRTVIDPLWNRDKFPALCVKGEIRKVAGDSRLVAKMTLYNEKTPDQNTIAYIAFPRRADGAFNESNKWPEPQLAVPREWATALPYVTLKQTMNIISEAESTAQQKKVSPIKEPNCGSEFTGHDDIRGILIEWAGRITGKPYWQSGGENVRGYGPNRNSRQPRCILEIKGDNPDRRQAKKDMVTAINLQANKHTSSLGGCDRLIIQFLFESFGKLVHEYSGYEAQKKNGTDGKTSPWNLIEFRNFIVPPPAAPTPLPLPLPAPAPVPAPAPAPTPAPAPAAAPGPGPAAGAGSAAGAGPTAGADRPMPAPNPIRPVSNTRIGFAESTDSSTVVVTFDRVVLARIPFKGQYAKARDALQQEHQEMGDEWFRVAAVQHQNFKSQLYGRN